MKFARQIYRLNLAALLTSKANEFGLVMLHDDARIRANDEVATGATITKRRCQRQWIVGK